MTKQNAPKCPTCGSTDKEFFAYPCDRDGSRRDFSDPWHREPAAPPEGETMQCTCEPPDYEGQPKLNGGREKDCPVHGDYEPEGDYTGIGRNGPTPRCTCGSHKLALFYHRPECPAASAIQREAVASPAMSAPAGMMAAEQTSMMYYVQKDGCSKHKDGCGKICYDCVEEALAHLRGEVARLTRDLEYQTNARSQDAADNRANFLEWKKDHHEPVLAELARLREQVRWIPVEERLPKVGGTYIVRETAPEPFGECTDFGHFRILETGIEWMDSASKPIVVTYWREFPTPPQAHAALESTSPPSGEKGGAH